MRAPNVRPSPPPIPFPMPPPQPLASHLLHAALALFFLRGSLAEAGIGELIARIEGTVVEAPKLFHFSDAGAPTILFNSDDAEEEEEETHHDQWMNSGKFQGDIAGVDPSIYGVDNIVNDGRQYNAIRNRQLRWPNGQIAYVLAPNYTPREKAVIEGAMQTYHQKTCLSFVPRTSESDYLYITKSYGCYSQVGRVRGRQELSLGNGCIYHEIAVHELMHALGFWHEHSRADRDQFIKIQWHNIIPGMAGQFDKISTAYQDFLGETYDYKSVMHYDSRAFSKNGLDTIETVQPGFTSSIGRAKDLSDTDLRKVQIEIEQSPPEINKLYQCSKESIKEKKSVITRKIAPTPGPIVRPQTFKPNRPQPPAPGSVVTPQPPPTVGSGCVDKFLDCPFFHRYCFRRSFFFIMRLYCPKTCGHCSGGSEPQASEAVEEVQPQFHPSSQGQGFHSLFATHLG